MDRDTQVGVKLNPGSICITKPAQNIFFIQNIILDN